jgi:ATP-dependent Clp protease ATP-binding subunit ClpB
LAGNFIAKDIVKIDVKAGKLVFTKANT